MCLLKMVEKGETIKRREREPHEARGNKRQARSVIINTLRLGLEAKGQTGSRNRLSSGKAYPDSKLSNRTSYKANPGMPPSRKANNIEAIVFGTRHSVFLKDLPRRHPHLGLVSRQGLIVQPRLASNLQFSCLNFPS